MCLLPVQIPYPLFILDVHGLEEWPLELLGKTVEVKGFLQRKRIYPKVRMDRGGSVSQGMDGIPLVIGPESRRVIP